MFTFQYVQYIPFVCPNPIPLNWNWGALSNAWEISIYTIFIFNMIGLGYFYFLTKPDPQGMRRFVNITIGLFMLGTGFFTWFVYYHIDFLSINLTIWTFDHFLASALAGFFTTVQLYLISLIIYILLSKLRIPWQLRAMRKYPFTFV